MSWEFKQVAGEYSFTEGPAWDGSGVVFTNMMESRMLRYDPETGETRVHYEDTNGGNGIKFYHDGALYVCEGGEPPLRREGRRITRYDPDGSRTVLAAAYEGDRFNSPNDLEIDSQGRIWFTDPAYNDIYESEDDDEEVKVELDHDSVYRLDPTDEPPWEVTRVTYDTHKPNGILLSPDEEWLYVAECPVQGREPGADLRAYPVEDDGSLGEHRILHNFAPHRGIDGMCLDEDGNIVATAGSEQSGPGPMIYVFAPSGRVLETHPLSAFPTNCVFGGPDYQTLYVTAGGCLYEAETGRTGRHQPF